MVVRDPVDPPPFPYDALFTAVGTACLALSLVAIAMFTSWLSCHCIAQNLTKSSSPIFTGLTVSWPANSFIYHDTTSVPTSSRAPIDGHLLIGQTGGIPQWAAQTCSENQMVVTHGAGSTTSGVESTNGQNLRCWSWAVAGPHVPGTIIGSGTGSQVTVTNGAGTITLGVPQTGNTNSLPSFPGLTISTTNNCSVLRPLSTFLAMELLDSYWAAVEAIPWKTTKRHPFVSFNSYWNPPTDSWVPSHANTSGFVIYAPPSMFPAPSLSGSYSAPILIGDYNVKKKAALSRQSSILSP